MKKPFLVTIFLITNLLTYAQFGGILNKAKKTVEDAGKTIEAPKEVKSVEETSDKPASQNTSPAAPASLKTYSKFDFVPGEKIIVYEDFMQDAIGDFPDKWNTNASGETVTIEGKPGHWLMINKQGIFMPEFIDSLPDNFTLEYDLLCDKPSNAWAFYSSIVTLEDRNHPEQWQNSKSRFTFTVAPQADASVSSIERSKDGVGEGAANTNTKKFTDKTKPVHVAVWRQKERMRVYFDEEKVWDLPKVMSKNAKYNGVVYWLQGAIDGTSYYLGNLRLAVGAPDTRKKILEQNKWVTHGILFDVNSDNIKPESYGTIKEMADVLKEYADLKVKIVGHTDADGKDADNLDLSKRRAASVKTELAKEFGIDGSRMETDGKGEGEPIDKNDTPAGKANNRRVEFIKI